MSNADGSPVALRSGVGISLECPCGNKDCSRIYIGFSNPVDVGSAYTSGPKWSRVGDDFNTLSLTPSIQRMSNCHWHGFITNGEIVKC